MKNVDLSIRGDVLTIKIRLDQEVGESQSGRSILISTTHGNFPIMRGKVPTGLLLNLNLYRRNDDYVDPRSLRHTRY